MRRPVDERPFPIAFSLRVQQDTAQTLCRLVASFSSRLHAEFPAHAQTILTQALQSAGVTWHGEIKRWKLPQGGWLEIHTRVVKFFDERDEFAAWWAPSKAAAEFALQAGELEGNPLVIRRAKMFLNIREEIELRSTPDKRTLAWEIAQQALFDLEKRYPNEMRLFYERQLDESSVGSLVAIYKGLQEQLFELEEQQLRPPFDAYLSVRWPPWALLYYFPRSCTWQEQAFGQSGVTMRVRVETSEWAASVRIECSAMGEDPAVLEGSFALEPGQIPMSARLVTLRWPQGSWCWFVVLQAWIAMCRGYRLQGFSLWSSAAETRAALEGMASKGWLEVVTAEEGRIHCEIPASLVIPG